MILIHTVRVSGFRGLKNIEVELKKNTILTGTNNSGKTSFLKALQLALGKRNFITQDDFYIGNDDRIVEKIIIDLKIVPIDQKGKRNSNFTEEWINLFTISKIKYDSEGEYIPLRTVINYDKTKNVYSIKQTILVEWYKYRDSLGKLWDEQDKKGAEQSFSYEEIPFFYVEAQRDILDDIKVKNSYFGKLISKLEYPKETIELLECEINKLNLEVVEGSDVLKNIKENLNGIKTTMDSQGGGIEIAPFTKKIRDLNKGFSLYYGESKNSFSMEYHGMGTRSWSSLLALKSFVNYSNILKQSQRQAFFPIIALEEPESHLHPNAQKKLYSQIKEIDGQKIISTHSPYILECAELDEIINFYKEEDNVILNKLQIENFDTVEKRQISRTVVKSRGELFFAKIIVLVEGETEEQVLTEFANNYFNNNTNSLGIEFVKVNGSKGYSPFIKFAESFGIPWIILSDNDQNGKIKKDVERQIADFPHAEDFIVFLDEGNDLETEILKNGYKDEIIEYLLAKIEYANDSHKKAQEPKDIKKFTEMGDEQLITELSNSKTDWSSVVPGKILEKGKKIPPKIKILFDKIKSILEG